MRNNEWEKIVLKRLDSVICLVTKDSIYHKSCERKLCKHLSPEEKKRGEFCKTKIHLRRLTMYAIILNMKTNVNLH